MIFDRTKADVDAAISIRREKVQKFIPLTAEEELALKRGLFLLDTITRIEEKQAELARLFSAEGYFVEVPNKTWTENDVFYRSDFQRLLDNNKKLVGAFFVYANTPKTPSMPSFKYQTVNDIEKVLNDLQLMLADLIGRKRQCGTFYCGEVNQQ